MTSEPSRVYRFLLVEDNPSDARLLQHALKRTSYQPILERVDTEAAFRAALSEPLDLILCDWSLPTFSALEALKIVNELGLDLPFLIISGTIGEETAVEAMRLGADDYLLKDRLGRLGPSIDQAFRRRASRLREQQSREAIRVSELRYRTLAESLAQIVWSTSNPRSVEFVNPRFTEYTGWDPRRLENYYWLRLIHPEDRPLVLAKMRLTPVPGKSLDMECRIRCRVGIYRWHSARHVAIQESNDTRLRWMGICTDIHEQKLAAERLAQHAEVLANVRDAVIVTDSRAEIIYWNEGATRLFGYDVSEMMGKNVLEPAGFPEMSNLPKLIDQCTLLGGWSGEFEETRRDGSTVLTHTRITVTHDHRQQGKGFMIVARDITAQRRAEQTLDAVMRSVTDAIITIDERGTILSANPAVVKLFGYEVHELIGEDIAGLASEAVRKHHGSYLSNYLRTGLKKVINASREILCQRRDGSTFSGELSVTEFFQDGIRRFTGVIRDITERKRLEEQFRQSQKMEAMGRLAGGVAHDFNNLLTVINGHTELLLADPQLLEQFRSPLAEIQDAGHRAAELTSHLLSFSRKAIVQPKRISLNDLMSRLERLLRRLIGEDIALSVVLDPRLGTIEADPGRIDQVIMNIVVNARDAMPRGGTLIMATRDVLESTDGNKFHAFPVPLRFAELSISDTGCGMPKSVVEHIFEPFFTTKEATKGTGLGLAVVEGIVRQANGTIHVESEVGKGTTFTLRFPVVDAPVDPRAAPDKTTASKGAQTILLVEDEPSVRTVIRLILAPFGYRILDAASGTEALVKYANEDPPPDLLLSDVVMPGINGRDFAHQMRQRYPDLRVLFMSGYADDALIRYGEMDDSLESFIQKPFTAAELAKQVTAALTGPPSPL